MSILKHLLFAAVVAVGLTGGSALAEPSLTVSFSTRPAVVLVPMASRYGYDVVGRRYYRYEKGHRHY